ncbi:MAG: hypothetical protein KAS67_03680 [Thermoplasmata archaeon]|nr:hypothetical protein [Thermoplasmata archaeon]
MNKADILNMIKDAEEKAERIKKSAAVQKEKNLAKAKNEAQAKITEGRTRSKALYENMLTKASEEIAKEKELVLAKANRQIEALKLKANAGVEEASDFLIKEFERKANGA